MHVWHSFTAAYRGMSRNLWLLALVMLVNRSGAMVLLYMSIYLTRAKQFSIQEAGYVMTLYGLGSITGAYVGGKLSDQIGFYKVMLLGLVGTGSLLFLLAEFHSFWTIAVCTFFVSAVGDMFRPANAASLSFYSESGSYAQAVSLNRLAMNLGYSVGPMLGGFLAGFNFKYLFWADGLSSMLAAFCLWRFLPKPPPSASKTPAAVASATRVYPLLNPQYALFLLGLTLYALCFFQLITAWPLFYKNQYGFSEPQIGSMMMINGLSVAILEMSFVHRVQHKWPALRLIRWGIVLLMGAFLLLIPVHSVAILIVSMCLLTASEMFSMPFMNTYAMHLAPPANTGIYMSFYTMSWSTAMMLAPLLGSQAIARWGYSGLWFSVSMALLGAFIVFFYIERKFKGAQHI